MILTTPLRLEKINLENNPKRTNQTNANCGLIIIHQLINGRQIELTVKQTLGVDTRFKCVIFRFDLKEIFNNSTY
jgi:predicted metalloenzyme YecM